MLGVGLDDLVQREAARRQRRLVWLAAASLAGMAVTSTLAVTAIQARDAAREQRRQAEGLVAFMLGDLKDKLEPIGRLDALDGVGSRVLAYYQNEGTADLSDAALLQRSQALSLTAEVAYERGSLADAQKLYREALAGTGEAIHRNPGDPQRIYDHAQNVFWLADIDRQLGHIPKAEAGMREYKRLADRMVQLAPDNIKWRMEQQSADTNLGVLLFDQRKFADATAQFVPALAQIQALTTADPQNPDYQVALTESEAWLVDARGSQGQLREAAMLGDQLLGLLNRLLTTTRDVEYRQKLVTEERQVGLLYQSLGDMQSALTHYRASVAHAAALIALEPSNSRWRSFGTRANLSLAEALIAAGQKDEAAIVANTACSSAARLVRTDPKVQTWRGDFAECWTARAQLASANGDSAQAASFAQRAVEIAATVRSTDPVLDRFALARDYRLLGDARQRLRDPSGAIAAWQQGLTAIPTNVAEKPGEMAEHVMLLERLGRQQDAKSQAERLAAIGYRDPELRNLKEL
jgi:tetratricopeptide (TPR) repeat protein